MPELMMKLESKHFQILVKCTFKLDSQVAVVLNLR